MNSSRIRVLLLPVLVLLHGCGSDTDSGQAGALRFTAIPDQNSTELEEKFQPLSLYLSEQLGIDVEYVPARDYQASVEMFRNGDVHLGWFGGLTGVQAREAVPGASAIAQGSSDPEYFSYFIAHRDTGLVPGNEFPRDVASLKFVFGSESSTSGRLMPEFFIQQFTGLAPNDYFENPVGFSGSHDRTAELVESGQFELGALNYKVYDSRVAAGETDPDVARVIWRTPTYADYNWTAHPNLESEFGAGFTDRLQQVLIAIDDPQLLVALPRDRLISATNEAFHGIKQVAQSLGMMR